MVSNKPIKPLEELVGYKRFRIPSQFANERDPETMKPCVLIQIGGKKWFIPVNESTEIAYEPFCALKDAGILGKNRNYEEKEEFDPFKANSL